MSERPFQQLHLQNFGKRRQLIEEKKYDPTKETIRAWWSKNLIPPEKNVGLFQAKPEVSEKKLEEKKREGVLDFMKRKLWL